MSWLVRTPIGGLAIGRTQVQALLADRHLRRRWPLLRHRHCRRITPPERRKGLVALRTPQESEHCQTMLVDEGLEILDDEECWRLLGTAALGRVAVTIGALPAIFPVNYAVLDRAVVFRTGEGTKLRAALDRAVVAFEVDQGDAIYHGGWSVQVVGVAEEVPPEVVNGIAPIPVAPWAPGARTHYVQIRPELISGRRITRTI